jgi:hypothetical protein
MSQVVDFGISGVRLSEGDHVCAFYQGPGERNDVLMPYLRAGLAAGDKCVCIVDATDLEAVVVDLRTDLGEEREQVEHQLDVLTVERACRRTGAFGPGEMLEFWDETVSAALGPEGFTFVRGVGDMTWATRDVPGLVAQVILFESMLNRFLPLHPQVILCLYDIERFSGEMIVEAVKTHPKILVRGAIVENPDYLEPDEFLAGRS